MAVNIDITQTQVIKASREEVFAYIADMKNDPEWVERIATVRQIKGNKPEKGACYTCDQIMPDGAVVPVTFTIDEIVAPSRLVWVVNDEMMAYRAHLELEAVEGGTRVTQRNVNRIKPVPEEMQDNLQAWAQAGMDAQMVKLAARFAL